MPKHEYQSAGGAIHTAQERTGEKFTLLPCPHCGHSAHLAEPKKDPDTWGGYRWEIFCSSSHCRASVSIIADGWFEQVNMELNPRCSNNGYRDRVTDLRDKWNRRTAPLHILRLYSHGGSTKVADYLMSDGSIKTMTPEEARQLR